MSAILVDTNVLVYSFDPRDQGKQAQALNVIGLLIRNARAVLSVQCLTEFFRIVRWRLPEPLPPERALLEVNRFSRACPVYNLTLPVVLEACRASNDYQMPIWDAQIWAIARVNQVSLILSEDAQHGRVIGGIQYLDPFHNEFDAVALETR